MSRAVGCFSTQSYSIIRKTSFLLCFLLLSSQNKRRFMLQYFLRIWFEFLRRRKRQVIIAESKTTSSVSSPNRFSFSDEPRKCLSINDLKNVNRTLLRSYQDFYKDNQGDDYLVSVSHTEEMEDSVSYEFQLESDSFRRSSISTVEDLSNKVKRDIVKEKINLEDIVKSQIQVGYWI